MKRADNLHSTTYLLRSNYLVRIAMNSNLESPRKQVTPNSIRARKNSDSSITLVSAYDYPFAKFAENAGVDIVFVSDAFASVGLGRPDTLSVTVDEVIYHSKAVCAGVDKSLVLAAMPHLTYTGPREAINNASRIIKEGGASAVEVEGCVDLAPTVKALVDGGIAVVGHVGLTKKVAARTGSYRTQGQDANSALAIIEDALALADAGAFAIILECIPDRLAAIITKLVNVPTIGFGAGPYCDGQALITQDLLGLFDKFVPKFVRQYAQLGDHATQAFRDFKHSVTEGEFPSANHSVGLDDLVLHEMVKGLRDLKLSVRE